MVCVLMKNLSYFLTQFPKLGLSLLMAKASQDDNYFKKLDAK